MLFFPFVIVVLLFLLPTITLFLLNAREARRVVASRELRSERKMKDGKKEEEKSGRETEVENQVGQGQASFNLNREIKFND